MALPNPAAFTRILAAHIQAIKDHLEGAIGSTAPWHFRQSSGSFQITLPDNAGATTFRLNDSDGADIFHVDSNGVVTAPAGISSATLILPLSVTPAPTAEGSIIWDTDDNVITVGDGAATKTFLPDPTTTLGDMTYASAAKVLTRIPIGAAATVLTVSGGIPAWVATSTAHLEAKISAGGASSESVTWTTAFSGAPIVVATAYWPSASGGQSVVVTAKSTTGATMESRDTDTSSPRSTAKMAQAMMAT